MIDGGRDAFGERLFGQRNQRRLISGDAPECGHGGVRQHAVLARRQTRIRRRPRLGAQAEAGNRLKRAIALRRDETHAAGSSSRRRGRCAMIGSLVQRHAVRDLARPHSRSRGRSPFRVRQDQRRGGQRVIVMVGRGAENDFRCSAGEACRQILRIFALPARSGSRDVALALPRERQQRVGLERRRPSIGREPGDPERVEGESRSFQHAEDLDRC